MQLLCVWSFLLVFLSLHFVAMADHVEFNVRINEKGTRFKETIKINEKENTILFVVPKHAAVDGSEVLNDFNLNWTITRVPKVGICHIKKLEKRLPSPRTMKSDLAYIKNAHSRIRKQSILESSSEWAFEKRLKTENLHPTVLKFCAGLPVYRLKEINKDDSVIVEGETSVNETISRRKRDELDFKMCPGSFRTVAGKCNPDNWTFRCKFVYSGTCVYWVRCPKKAKTTTNGLKDCSTQHQWNAVVCCIPSCPTK